MEFLIYTKQEFKDKLELFTSKRLDQQDQMINTKMELVSFTFKKFKKCKEREWKYLQTLLNEYHGLFDEKVYLLSQVSSLLFLFIFYRIILSKRKFMRQFLAQ